MSVRTQNMVRVDGSGGGASEKRGGGEKSPKSQDPQVGATSTIGDQSVERTVPHDVTRDSSSAVGGSGETDDSR